MRCDGNGSEMQGDIWGCGVHPNAIVRGCGRGRSNGSAGAPPRPDPTEPFKWLVMVASIEIARTACRTRGHLLAGGDRPEGDHHEGRVVVDERGRRVGARVVEEVHRRQQVRPARRGAGAAPEASGRDDRPRTHEGLEGGARPEGRVAEDQGRELARPQVGGGADDRAGRRVGDPREVVVGGGAAERVELRRAPALDGVDVLGERREVRRPRRVRRAERAVPQQVQRRAHARRDVRPAELLGHPLAADALARREHRRRRQAEQNLARRDRPHREDAALAVRAHAEEVERRVHDRARLGVQPREQKGARVGVDRGHRLDHGHHAQRRLDDGHRGSCGGPGKRAERRGAGGDLQVQRRRGRRYHVLHRGSVLHVATTRL